MNGRGRKFVIIENEEKRMMRYDGEIVFLLFLVPSVTRPKNVWNDLLTILLHLGTLSSISRNRALFVVANSMLPTDVSSPDFSERSVCY